MVFFYMQNIPYSVILVAIEIVLYVEQCHSLTYFVTRLLSEKTLPPAVFLF